MKECPLTFPSSLEFPNNDSQAPHLLLFFRFPGHKLVFLPLAHNLFNLYKPLYAWHMKRKTLLFSFIIQLPLSPGWIPCLFLSHSSSLLARCPTSYSTSIYWPTVFTNRSGFNTVQKGLSLCVPMYHGKHMHPTKNRNNNKQKQQANKWMK